jgi:hypothetical protein
MTNPIHFVVGKFYRDADGRKYKCLEVERPGADWKSRRVLMMEMGTGWVCIDTCFIVGKWIDRPAFKRANFPAWAKWIAMDSYGAWHWFVEMPNQGRVGWGGAGAGYIPSAYAPKYEGSWEDSLVELDPA